MHLMNFGRINHDFPLSHHRHYCLGITVVSRIGADKTGVVWMNIYTFAQIFLYMEVLLLLVKPLGNYMAKVYQGEHLFLSWLLSPIERFIYRFSDINPQNEMTWKVYAVALLLFNFIGLIFVYALQRFQAILPLNPQGLGAVTPDSAWNTAVSFASNTNWQGYGGEVTMSYLTQMLGLTVQNFVSAATGIAVLIALIRGITRHTTQEIGNFWVDITRSTLYILMPLSCVLALVLISQGVVQTFSEYQTVSLVQPSAEIKSQVVAVGPAASQIAIKQLGTNGGGFFNVNSAHPFENPTPFTNFLQMVSILLIPAALSYTFGKMVGDTRQGWALLIVMTIIFGLLLGIAVWSGSLRLVPRPNWPPDLHRRRCRAAAPGHCGARPQGLHQPKCGGARLYPVSETRSQGP